jgi:hypothetical protein
VRQSRQNVQQFAALDNVRDRFPRGAAQCADLGGELCCLSVNPAGGLSAARLEGRDLISEAGNRIGNGR